MAAFLQAMTFVTLVAQPATVDEEFAVAVVTAPTVPRPTPLATEMCFVVVQDGDRGPVDVENVAK